jgi:uncharacterized membrane protein YqjE
MESSANNSPHPFTRASKRLAQQTLVICENRLELLLVELQEERDRILQAFWLSLAVAVFGVLTGIALSVVVAVACWDWSPIGALLILSAIYAAIAAGLYLQLGRVRRDWQTLPATFDELRKDRECLEKSLN